MILNPFLITPTYSSKVKSFLGNGSVSLKYSRNFEKEMGVLIGLGIRFLRCNFLKAVIVPTGYTYMKQGLSEISDAWIGGEYSGHICPKEYFNIDDGIVTSALLLQYVAQLKENGKTLDDILDQFPHYEGTPEIRFSGPNEVLQRRNIVQKIKEEFIQEGYDINDIDGVRATFKSENGWALIRSSNTGPQFTLRAEAKTYEGLEAILDIMLKKIQKAYPEGNIKNLKNK